MKDFKPMRELISVLLDIAKIIKGESGGGSNKKSLGYFGLTNNPIGVTTNTTSSYDEEVDLIKIEDFVEQLGVPKEVSKGGIPPTFVFVYDKDVSNTVNFDSIKEISAKISDGLNSCIELAPNRFCFNDAE